MLKMDEMHKNARNIAETAKNEREKFLFKLEGSNYLVKNCFRLNNKEFNLISAFLNIALNEEVKKLDKIIEKFNKIGYEQY